MLWLFVGAYLAVDFLDGDRLLVGKVGASTKGDGLLIGGGIALYSEQRWLCMYAPNYVEVRASSKMAGLLHLQFKTNSK